MSIAASQGRRAAWAGLAVLSLPTLLVTMDMSVLFLAVPKLTRALHPSSGQLLWIADIYGFLIAGSLLIMGALGDRFGRRRVLLAGGATFAAGSLLAAFSVSPAMLIGARALLGVAGGALAPSSLALIHELFEDERERTTAIGIWVSCFAVGAAIGPLVGGLLLDNFWWGSVFLPNVVAMMLLLVLGPRVLPESRPARSPQPVQRPLATAARAIGAVGAMLRLPVFSVALLANATAAFVAIGIELLTAQYLQLVLGLSPLVAGLWSMPSALAIVAGAMLAPICVRVARPPIVVAAGLLVAATGLAVLMLAGTHSGLAAIVAGSSLIGLGVGPVGTLGTDLVIGAAPSERAGVASGMSETSTELGGALGIAVLGSIASAGGPRVHGLHLAAISGAAIAACAAILVLRLLGGRSSVHAPQNCAELTY